MFPAVVLKDQFDNVQKVEKTDRWVMLSFEKDVAVKLSRFMKQKPADYSGQYHIRIISDISSMPGFITTMFALPKMRKYPFSVMLIRDDLGKQFDRQKGKVTLYRLHKGKIVSISFVDPEALESYMKPR